MNDIQSAFDALEDLFQQVEALGEKIDILRSAISFNFAPYKNGETVYVPKGAYVHVGKKAEVMRCDASRSRSYRYGHDFEYEWIVTVRLFRKDGSLGLQEASWREPVRGIK